MLNRLKRQLERSKRMDFSIKPVSETLFQDNHPFYTTNKRISENNLLSGQGKDLNVGAVQQVSDDLKSSRVPEVGKGANIDIYA